MKRPYLRNGSCLVLLGFALLCPRPALADDPVVVVLSSNLSPYQETLAGLQHELGFSPPVLYLADHNLTIPAGTRVIVAIGGEAAAQKYPRDAALVYCVAPGVLLPSNEHRAPTAKIYMTPSADVVLDKLRDIQPQLRSLGILSLTQSRDAFNDRMKQLGKGFGIAVIVEKMRSPEELPDRLRGLQPHINALWIPPDPRLISRQNFDVIKEFCLSHHIPLYVPTIGLVEQGAVASVAVSFDQMGRTAGQKVKDLLAGTLKDGKIYPEKFVLAIGRKAAADSGLTLSQEQLDAADKLIP